MNPTREGGSWRRPGAAGTTVLSEPDPATATIEDWRVYRRKLAAMPVADDVVRVAIAVAEAQIAKLRRKLQER